MIHIISAKTCFLPKSVCLEFSWFAVIEERECISSIGVSERLIKTLLKLPVCLSRGHWISLPSVAHARPLTGWLKSKRWRAGRSHAWRNEHSSSDGSCSACTWQVAGSVFNKLGWLPGAVALCHVSWGVLCLVRDVFEHPSTNSIYACKKEDKHTDRSWSYFIWTKL